MSTASRLDIIACGLAVFFLLMMVLAVRATPPTPVREHAIVGLTLAGEPANGERLMPTAEARLSINGVTRGLGDFGPSDESLGAAVVQMTATASEQIGSRALLIRLPIGRRSDVELTLNVADWIREGGPTSMRAFRDLYPRISIQAAAGLTTATDGAPAEPLPGVWDALAAGSTVVVRFSVAADGAVAKPTVTADGLDLEEQP